MHQTRIRRWPMMLKPRFLDACVASAVFVPWVGRVHICFASMRLCILCGSFSALPNAAPASVSISHVHWGLYECIVETAIELEQPTALCVTLKTVITSFAVSWTKCKLTLQELLDTVATETEPWGQIPLAQVTHCLQELIDAAAWPFLQQPRNTAPPCQPDCVTLEAQCRQIAFSEHARGAKTLGASQSDTTCVQWPPAGRETFSSSLKRFTILQMVLFYMLFPLI